MKKKTEEVEQVEEQVEQVEQEVVESVKKQPERQSAMEMIVGKKALASELKMSMSTLDRYLSKYPFEACGIPGKVMGSWRLDKADVYRWWRWVQSQELRHPDSRRLRPEEPPDIQSIVGR